MTVAVERFRELWEPTGVYCNTASFGLPPRPGWEALESALADWHAGRTSWEGWGETTEAARASFARLAGVPVAHVAVGATVSELMGAVVTALPEGARVVVPDYQLSLAIGREGQNARLAARLTGWRIDIRSDTAPATPPA